MAALNDNKTKYIRFAAIIALIGNAILALLKIVTGILMKSGALIGDGIDSSTDILISIITLVVVKILLKPADAEHPWGHKRAETVATAFLSFVIFFAGAQLIITSISNLTAGIHSNVSSPIAIVVPLISIIGKLLLAYSQYNLGKRANSAIIKANAKNMTNDVLISLGVLVGFGISRLTGSAYADTVVAILVGIWIIKTAIGVFLDANIELMDGSRNKESYRVIIDAVNAVDGAHNPHRARMRRIAGFWDIDFDIGVDPQCTVIEAHAIATRLENEIKNRLENVFDIMIHVEPQGDDSVEAFGLSADDMNEDKTRGRGNYKTDISP